MTATSPVQDFSDKISVLQQADDDVLARHEISRNAVNMLQRRSVTPKAWGGKYIASANRTNTSFTLQYHPDFAATKKERDGKQANFVDWHEMGHLLKYAEYALLPPDHPSRKAKMNFGSTKFMYLMQGLTMVGLTCLTGTSPGALATNALAATVTGLAFRYQANRPVRRVENQCDALAAEMTATDGEFLPDLRDELLSRTPRQKAERWFHKNMPFLYRFYDSRHPTDQKRQRNMHEFRQGLAAAQPQDMPSKPGPSSTY